MNSSDEYEWGILFVCGAVIHRSGMTEQEARDWLAEWVSDGGRTEGYALTRRKLGEWQEVAAKDRTGTVTA